jgi:hypothetical protein
VLAQLGSRIQHQLRAATPNDAKALKQTVNTYPHSAYDDLGKVILSLGIGEAVVTVMNERGAPTPVAWTKLRAPESRIGPADQAAMEAQVQASPLRAKYAETVDRESAHEMLAKKLEAGAEKAAAEAAKGPGTGKGSTPEDRLREEGERATRRRKAPPRDKSMVEEVVSSTAFRQVMRTAAREIVRGMFRTGRR